MGDLYYIACTIERGAFTNERTFEIELSETIKLPGEQEGKLVGTAHADHLRNGDKTPLAEDEPQFGNVIKGFVLCRKIRDLPKNWVLAEVPSADMIHVSADSLAPVLQDT